MNNASVEEIVVSAANMTRPAIMVGVASDDSVVVRVVDGGDDYCGDGGPFERDYPFGSLSEAWAAYAEIRRRLAELRPRKSFRPQLEALRASGRCVVEIFDHEGLTTPQFRVLFGRERGGSFTVGVVVIANPDRVMQDKNSLAKLVEAVEEFTRREGL